MSLGKEKKRAKLCCYVCDCTFDDGKLHENMFDKRYNVRGEELEKMANVLSMALGYRLHKSDMHTTQICIECKNDLLSFKHYQEKLLSARIRLLEQQANALHFYDSEDGFAGDTIASNENLLAEFENVAELAEPRPARQRERIIFDNFFEINFDDIIEECPDSDDDRPLLLISLDAEAISILNGPPLMIDHTCKYCGRVFERRQWLEEHERIHTGERPHKCEVCNAEFAQRSNFRTHMRTTHENLAAYKCEHCDRAFKRKRLLNNHVKSKHTMVRDLKCDECDATFGNVVNLRKHMLRHTGEKRYDCLICGKKFTSPETRNVHHFVHSIRKPYACVVCDMEFMRKHDLQKHIKVTMHANPNIVRREPVFSAANMSKMQQNAAAAKELPHTITTADGNEVEMPDATAAAGEKEIPHTVTSAME